MWSSYGNGTIDRYPLKRLLIFTEKVFKSLKKEISRFKLFETKPRAIDHVIQPSNIKKEQIPARITHDYEPSNILYVQDSAPWRWRRVNEWFAQQAQMEATPSSTLDEIVAVLTSERLTI